MIKKSDLNEFNEFVCFKGEYCSFEEAQQDGAIYRSGSVIDALTIQSNSTTGYFDIGEIISVIEKLIGSDEIIWGILTKDKVFVRWEDAAYAISNT